MSKNSTSYIPFARKYRPTKFSELLGQEVLTKTLTYCIQNNRLAQAHLLTGIRGVGKTSSARIIAKTVNCTNLQKNDAQILPCDECTNCRSFNNHNHPDIIEIDAASKTSVDDIREIIETSEYKPLLGQMKFFIIDEIHMLSKSAFNALLKIVEEPPEHVIFIFATTEVQKIPLTVVSRCQRYDLRRLTFDEINILVNNISEIENIKFEKEALRIISVKSEGSARDAVSMLDQAASYAYNTDDNSNYITANIVRKMLGLVDTGIIIKFVQLIIANDPTKAMNLLGEIYQESSSIEYFIQNLSDFIAELSKSKVINNYHSQLYQNYSQEISDILIGVSLSRITILWQIFSNGINEIKQSHNELVTAQMLIIKAVYSCNLPSAEEILNAEEVLGASSISNIKPALNTNLDPKIEQMDSGSSSRADKSKHDKNNTHLESIKGQQTRKTKQTQILDFLKYCHSNSEMEIYHLLLNQVEIKEFVSQKMQIASNTNISLNIITKMEKLLQKWSGQDWKISNLKQDSISSLKEEMLAKVKETGDYLTIKNKFPNANISDILLRL